MSQVLFARVLRAVPGLRLSPSVISAPSRGLPVFRRSPAPLQPPSFRPPVHSFTSPIRAASTSNGNGKKGPSSSNNGSNRNNGSGSGDNNKNGNGNGNPNTASDSGATSPAPKRSRLWTILPILAFGFFPVTLAVTYYYYKKHSQVKEENVIFGENTIQLEEDLIPTREGLIRVKPPLPVTELRRKFVSSVDKKVAEYDEKIRESVRNGTPPPPPENFPTPLERWRIANKEFAAAYPDHVAELEKLEAAGKGGMGSRKMIETYKEEFEKYREAVRQHRMRVENSWKDLEENFTEQQKQTIRDQLAEESEVRVRRFNLALEAGRQSMKGDLDAMLNRLVGGRDADREYLTKKIGEADREFKELTDKVNKDLKSTREMGAQAQELYGSLRREKFVLELYKQIDYVVASAEKAVDRMKYRWWYHLRPPALPPPVPNEDGEYPRTVLVHINLLVGTKRSRNAGHKMFARPGADMFLRRLRAAGYEVVVFGGSPKRIDGALAEIDKHGMVDIRMYFRGFDRTHRRRRPCINPARLQRPLDRVIVCTKKGYHLEFMPFNGLVVPKDRKNNWKTTDITLNQMLIILEGIQRYDVKDVRNVTTDWAMKLAANGADRWKVNPYSVFGECEVDFPGIPESIINREPITPEKKSAFQKPFFEPLGRNGRPLRPAFNRYWVYARQKFEEPPFLSPGELSTAGAPMAYEAEQVAEDRVQKTYDDFHQYLDVRIPSMFRTWRRADLKKLYDLMWTNRRDLIARGLLPAIELEDPDIGAKEFQMGLVVQFPDYSKLPGPNTTIANVSEHKWVRPPKPPTIKAPRPPPVVGPITDPADRYTAERQAQVNSGSVLNAVANLVGEPQRLQEEREAIAAKKLLATQGTQTQPK